MSATDNVQLFDKKVELLIPTQCGVCREPLPEDSRNALLKDMKVRFSDAFGGYSVTRIHGGWKMPDGTLAEEPVDVLWSKATVQGIEEHAEDARLWAVETADRLSQDAVALIINDAMAFFPRSNPNAPCAHKNPARVAATAATMRASVKSAKPSKPIDRLYALQSIISSFASLQDARALFCGRLAYNYADSLLPMVNWPDHLRQMLRSHPQVISDTNGFRIVHLHLTSDHLLRSSKRAIITRILKDDPSFHGLFLVSDIHSKHWELVNARQESKDASRFILRRMVVGDRLQARTPTERLALVDLSTRGEVSAADIQKLHDGAFDVERVTMEFFADYCRVFDEVCHIVMDRNQLAPEVAEHQTQVLLNRLLFLYFIQRKGWLNRRCDYLSTHFKEYQRRGRGPAACNYYEDFLRPVFVKLSTEGPQADIPGHDLPFLNGGLFSDEYGAEHRDYGVRLRHNLKIPNAAFKAIFNGLLDAYNFTVREDTPLDQEVAIDPEMLGKIFESLVLQLEQTGSGGKSSRHNTGSHYTPRPYVHYLCREGLRGWIEQHPPDPEQVADWPKRLQNLLTLDASDGVDVEERSTLDASLTPEEARTLADRLHDFRACDPGVGSGAFPVVLLHEMINLLRLCETRARGKDPAAQDAEWLYNSKARLIERTIYGVDIQERAVEICKLRLWLSLVVDYPLAVDVDSCDARSFRAALKNLPALPNLDFKIRRANSLIDYVRGERVDLGSTPSDSQAKVAINRLIVAKQNFFKAHSVSEKRGLRFEIYQCLAELAQHKLAEARNELGLIPDESALERVAELDKAVKEMGAVMAQIRDARKMKVADQEEALERLRDRLDDPAKPTFVWQFDFVEVFQRKNPPGKGGTPGLDKPRVEPGSYRQSGGFDLMMGNPPFVRIQVLNQTAPEQVAWFKQHYASAAKGNYDLYVVFVERSLQLLAPDGQFAFILPHKFFNAQYGEPLRELLAKGRYLRHVVHFGDQQIFPGATNYVCLLLLAKSGNTACRWVRADDLPSWLGTFQAPETTLSAARFTPAEWNFAVGKNAGLFEKLQKMPVKLGEVADIFVGLQTSADKLYVVKGVSKAKSGMVTAEDRNGDEWELERGILKPFLSDVSLAPYVVPTAEHWLIFPYHFANGKALLFTQAEIIKKFPKAWHYLKHNEKSLRSRESDKADGPDWFGYIYRKNLVLFDSPKLIIQVLSKSGRYAFDPQNLYFTGGGNGPYYGLRWSSMEEPPSLHYLQALLNSRLLDFYLQRISTPFRGGYFSYGKQFIAQLPIRPIDTAVQSELAEHDALVDLVDQTMKAKLVSPSADTTHLEQEINDRVYRLYGLSKDEIKIVEESSSKA